MPQYDKNATGVLAATDSYYNIVIKNNNTGFDLSGNPVIINNSTPLVFNETRSLPYIGNPSKHFMSVMSFQIDSQSLPIMICEPVEGSNNIKDTLYFFSIVDAAGTVVRHVRVQWVPEDLSTPQPPSPVPSNYTNYPYYFCYTYDYFLNILNDQIKTACTTPPLPGNPEAPFLNYENGNVVLRGARSHWETTANGSSPTPTTNKYRLFFNTELYYFFSSLPSIKMKEPFTTVKNMNFQLLFVVNPSHLNLEVLNTNLTPIPPGSPYTGVVSRAEYPPFAFWSPIDSIVFTTNYLNVVPELISANSPYGLSGGQNVSNANQFYILFDYMTPSSRGSDYQPNIIYTPQAEYRLSDLFGKEEVCQLKINVFWKDKWGIMHIFTLESGGSASIKLLFRKKVFYE
jgi:hypothetical protein